jgi:hypothetical protein
MDNVVEQGTSSTVETLGVTPRRIIPNASSEQTQSILPKLCQLTQLPVGWDGNQAKPVAYSNMLLAVHYLDAVVFEGAPVPSVVPGLFGNLQLEWHSEFVDIELHISSDTNVSFWCNDPAICPDGEDIPLDRNVKPLYEQLKKFSKLENGPVATAA